MLKDTLLEVAGTEEIVSFLVYGAHGASFVFGSWVPMIGILLVLCAIDIITGIAKGLYDKDLRSRKMSKGMISKAMYFVVVILANMIDMTVAGGLPVAKSAVLIFYISLEGLSILENLGQMNVPLPAFIKKYLIVLRDQGDSNKQITVQPNDEITTLEFKKIE